MAKEDRNGLKDYERLSQDQVDTIYSVAKKYNYNACRLAERIGTTSAFMSMWLSNKRRMDFEKIVNLYYLLNEDQSLKFLLKFVPPILIESINPIKVKESLAQNILYHNHLNKLSKLYKCGDLETRKAITGKLENIVSELEG